MACNTCRNKNQQTPSVERISPLECEYTLPMLVEWKNLLFCVRDKDLFEEYNIDRAQFNSFLGIIFSGINFEYNICFLAKDLDKIKPYITQIISDEKC